MHPSILTTISSVQVSETIKIIIGKEPNLANKLFLANRCKVCGNNVDLSIKETKRKLIEDICGREGKSVHIISPKKDLNINLNDLNKIIERRQFKIIRKGELGTTIKYNEQITISIVSSGVSIIVGALEERRALEIFSEIIIDELKINPEDIDNEFNKLVQFN